MASFPTLQFGGVTKGPLVRSKSYRTGVVTFADSSEQRWASRAPLGALELRFIRVDGYDLSLIRKFYRDMKGRFDKTWDITLEDSEQLQNCVFLDDDFPVVSPARNPGLFNLTLRCRQVRKN